MYQTVCRSITVYRIETMKGTILLLLCVSIASSLWAQEKMAQRNSTLKWAPAGLLAGNIGLQGEYNFGRNSLTAKIGIPVSAKHSLDYDGSKTKFTMKATTFMAGFRRYLSQNHLKGLYLEPFFKFVHHSSEGIGKSDLNGRWTKINFTNEYNGFGVGAQLGVQFLIGKRGVLDLFFLGPEINGATNKLKAVEQSSVIPWTPWEAQEAERDIREFIEQIPFIRRNTTIMIDKDNKRISADFKGVVPGYRLGVSFGITL